MPSLNLIVEPGWRMQKCGACELTLGCGHGAHMLDRRSRFRLVYLSPVELPG
jgi:hypothetical protein